MLRYADVIIDLKEKEIYPSNKEYSNQIEQWFKSNVDHKFAPKCTKFSWLEKFLVTFVRDVKTKWRQTNSCIKYGKSKSLDEWLNKQINVEFEDCSCLAEPAEPAEPAAPTQMDTTESQCCYRLIIMNFFPK